MANISLDTKNELHQQIEEHVSSYSGKIRVLPPQEGPKHQFQKGPRSRRRYQSKMSPAQAAFQAELDKLRG